MNTDPEIDDLPIYDEDDGLAEAIRRYDEVLANPEIGISVEEFRRRIAERFNI